MPRQDPIRQEAIDGDMNQLEHDVRQFKIEFEQYMGGGKKRPPNDLEWQIEMLIKRYGDRGAEMNYTQRFRFGNLTSTYAKFKEVFHKRMRRREEGKVERHFGAAARQIEELRARTRGAGERRPVSVALADPAHEPKKVAELYTAFREALEKAGEPTDKLTREQFQQFLQKKAADLRKAPDLSKNEDPRVVEFVVSVEDGKARLKARVRT
jgi:hypothetical protein